jgi:GT2 family glycosyltransferase
MKITALVLSWNSEKYISKCLDSLQKIFSDPHTFEIILVDNGSTDDSVSYLKTKYPQYHLIENNSNLGYAEGNNVGIRYALENKADFIWIVNPDVHVDPNALLHLIMAAQKYKDAGVFGSKIYFSPGYEFHKDRYTPQEIGHVIWFSGGEIDWANMLASHRGVDQVDKGQFDHDIETDFVTGASMFIRSRIFQEVGLFDPKYFLYFEENDFCQRAKKAGWKLMYIFQSVVWHANAQSTGIGSDLQDYYITRNQILFGLRHAPPLTKFALVRQAIKFYLSGRPWQRRAVLDYFTGNMGPGSFQP